MSTPPKIVVVGSLNIDHTLRVPHLPAPGETLTASGAFTSYGGKGANQALAAARAGASVTIIGCAGEDDFGTRYREFLRGEGIETGAIAATGSPTGSAFILVDEAGENSIVVNPGANHALRPENIDSQAAHLGSADAILLQLECPLPAVLRTVELAESFGVPVILNPSPLTPEYMRTGVSVDTLIVNEREAQQLIGGPLLGTDPSRTLAAARCRCLVVTRGAASTFVLNSEQMLSLTPPRVTPVDTVGAGDAFAGAFTVAQAGGASLADAVRFANAAGALATQKSGAQASIPTRREILASVAGNT